MNRIRLLDVVALSEDLPEKGLLRGQVGTVVEELVDAKGTPAFLVEFSDDDGQTYAMLPLLNHQLIVLHYQPVDSQLAPVT